MKRFATLLALVAVAVANQHVLVNPGLYTTVGGHYNPYVVGNPLIYGRPLVQVGQPELKELRKQYETVKPVQKVEVYARPEQIRPDQIRPEQIRPDQIRPDQIRPEVNVYEKKPEQFINPFEKRPEQIVNPFEKRPEQNVYEKRPEISVYEKKAEHISYARPEQVNTVFPGFTTPVRYAAASGRVQHVVSKREADSQLYLNPIFGYSMPTHYPTQYVYSMEQPKTYISPVNAPQQKTVADFASAHTPLYADKGRFFADSEGARMIAKRDTESFYPFYSNLYSAYNTRNVYNPYYATGYNYGFPYVY